MRPEAVQHLTQADLARRWRMSERTLEAWRPLNMGPPYLKIVGRVVVGAEQGSRRLDARSEEGRRERKEDKEDARVSTNGHAAPTSTRRAKPPMGPRRCNLP